MILCYIAGKFRGRTPWDVHRNVLRAEEAALRVAETGAFPICPHKNTEHFDGLLRDEFWLNGTLALMRRCDAVWIFDPAHLITSVGTQQEHNAATDLGMRVFIGDPGLAELQAFVREGYTDR